MALQILAIAKRMNRKCALCNTHNTFVNKKGIKRWYGYGDTEDFLCHDCYWKNKHFMENRNSDVKNKTCDICKATETKKNAYGGIVWRFDKNGRRICYYCNLSQMKRERENISKTIRCQSQLCVKSREKHGASPDYKNMAYCLDCKSNHSKTLINCPCCNRKLRNRPRYNREKNKCNR